MPEAPGNAIPPPPPSDWAAVGWGGASPERAIGPVRLASGLVALIAATVLTIAWILVPSDDGLGTHRQLGMPPCNWIVAANMPCPTCGMTTAFSHAAHGDLPASFGTQPMGAVLAVVTAATVLVAGWTALTGSMLAPFLTGLFGRRLFWISIVMLLLAWGWKIMDHRGVF
ncbi:MAG: hypothetical protein CBD91_01695 [Phycisphaeraceae bacterium TMED231]|nr:MAG: hypothetical protein CBD91_01695 [Phycisphaeraceae bacterium TMED231]